MRQALLRNSTQTPSSPPIPRIALVLLIGIYLFAGTAWHDPWKTEDAIHIAIAYGFINDGVWLFPHVAGEPWPHTPPLYHWVAALMGQTFGGLLGFHNAARLATTAFAFLFLLSISGAARTFHGTGAGRLAPLLAIGTLGLLLPLHEAQPAVAGLAFAALAYWGCARQIQGQAHGAPLTGLGLGLSIATHGISGLVMATPVLLAPTLRRDGKCLLTTLAVALPIAAAWPALLAWQAPQWGMLWWQSGVMDPLLGRDLPEMRHLEQLLWTTWPALPLALWSLWGLRNTGWQRHSPASRTIPLLGAVLALAWFLSGPSRTLLLLPLHIPLILLAAAGADRLRRGAASAFDWFSLVTFTCITALIWLGASAQALEWPPRIAYNFKKLAPGHELQYTIPALAFALLVTLAWITAWRLPRTPWRATLRWSGGLVAMWALVTTLWLSWIDYYKSYRPPALALRAALPHDVDCIGRQGLGAAQRAALDYYTSIRTVPLASERTCAWRLIVDDKSRVTPAGWLPRWQGNRPGDRDERWFLEQRLD